MSEIITINNPSSSPYLTPYLIRESYETHWHEVSREELMENKRRNGGKLVMTTLMQRADKRNQMGRIYPRHILEREFKNYQQYVDTKSAFGELNHPDSAVVTLPASHIVIKQWGKIGVEGKWEWWADVEIGNNSKGKDVQEMIFDGWRMSISSRAVGTTRHDNGQDADVVEDNLVIVAFDIVAQPSTHYAYLNMKECIDLQLNEPAFKRFTEANTSMLQSRISQLAEMDLSNRGDVIRG